MAEPEAAAGPWTEYQSPAGDQPKGPWSEYAAPQDQQEEVLHKIATGPFSDQLFADAKVNPVARTLDIFGQGVKQGWGADHFGLSPESEDFLKKAGIFNDYSKGQSSFVKATNQAVIRSAAMAFDATLRGPIALYHGIGDVAIEAGVPRDIVAIPEAFPAGGIETSFVRPRAVTPADLLKASELGVIGVDDATWAGTKERKPVSPDIEAETLRAQNEAMVSEGGPVPKEGAEPVAAAPEPPAPPDIHAIARSVDPSTMAQYDALSQRRDTFRRWIDELGEQRRTQAEADAPHTAEIADLRDRMETATPRLQKKYQARLDELEPLNEEAIAKSLEGDNADMARVRADLQKTDYAMRDLAPEVSAAYREAEKQMPTRAEPEAAAAVEAPRAVESEVPVSPEAPRAEGGVTVPSSTPSPEAAPVKPIPEQRAAIADDVTQKLIDAGRPKDEAQAAAQIIASHYESRAARFGGTKGSPEDLYNADAPEIRGTKKSLQASREASAAQSLMDSGGLNSAEQLADLGKRITESTKSGGVLSGESLLSVVNEMRRAGVKQGEVLDSIIRSVPVEVVNDLFGSERAAKVAFHNEAVLKNASAFDADLPVSSLSNRGRSVRLLMGQIALKGAERIESALGAAGKASKGVAAQGAENIDSLSHRSTKTASIKLLDNAKNIIKLSEKADASSFLHETGHQWLEELLSDVRDARATPQLRADGQAVLKWLGAETKEVPTPAPGVIRYYHGTTAESARGFEGKTFLAPDENYARNYHGNNNNVLYVDLTKEEAIKRGLYDETNGYPINGSIDDGATKLKPLSPAPEITTRQHEKFAKGFEQYMREGRAPSEALASVFEQFKDWLTQIYQTVKSLGRPIDKDIRGVFDRLIAEPREKTVIAPDREHAPAFAEKAEKLLTETPPEKAAGVADELLTERQSEARTVPEIDNERRVERDETGEGAPGGAVPDGGGNAPEPNAGGSGQGQGTGTLGSGGGGVAGEGAGLRGAAERIPEVATAGADAATGERGGNAPGRRVHRAGEQPTGPNEAFPQGESEFLDKAGNIRVDNLNVPEDVGTAIYEAADANEGFIGARRGVISDAQVLDLADALGMDAGSLNVRKIGEAFNAEQVVAARKLLIQSATEVRDAMVKAAQGTDEDVLAYATAKARHQMIQEQVAGLTAEAGRALRAFRSLEGTKEAALIGDFLQANTGKTLFQLRREAKLGSALDTAQKVSRFVNDSKKATWKDMLLEAWINALLSGPVTHMKNMIGNTVVAINSVAETGIAGAVGTMRRAVTGSEEGVRLGEAKSRLYGLVQGAQDGVVAGVHAYKNEELFTKTQTMEQRKFQAIPSAKVIIAGREFEIGGKQVRLPGRLLTAEDEFFKAIAHRQELNALAYRTASEEGLAGDAFNARIQQIVTSPTDVQMELAQKNAEYQTFTKMLGPTGRAIQQFANSHPLAKVVVPFIRTPTNLIKYAGERTPLGVFSSEVRANLSGTNGAVAQDTQIARMVMGTAVGVTMMKLAAEGMITGGGPSDPGERATKMATGWRPYSVKVGNGYYSYAWADPFSTIMGVSADLYDAAHGVQADDADLTKVGHNLFAAISKNLTSKLSLRGVNDLIQAVSDPDRYGERYIQNLAGSVVPSIIAQDARNSDPYMREARSVVDTLKSRVRGLRETLPVQRDRWGEPIPNQGALGPDVLSPIYQSAVNNDPVNKALDDLHMGIAQPDRKLRGVELTADQYDDYSRISGRLAKMQLNAIVNSPRWADIPAVVQKDMISKTISGARQAAQAQVMMKNPEIIQKAVDAKTSALKKPGSQVGQ